MPLRGFWNGGLDGILGGLRRGFADADDAADEVDVAPVEGDEFGGAQAGPEGELHQIACLAFEPGQNGGLFFLGEWVDVVLRVGGGGGFFIGPASERVGGDQFVFEGFL